MTNEYTITLSDGILIRSHAGEAIRWNPSETPDILSQLALVGAKTILTNVWNGGGKDATDAERLAALTKKLDAWKRGEFNVTERGESQFTAMREVYIADCVAAGLTTKQAETALRDKVAAFMGADTKATFANFLEASAIEAAKAGDMSRDEAREALESYYAAEADKREKERAKAGAKIEAPKIDLAAFIKPKAK